jgi:arsenate reductase (thioredoxin)
MSRPSVVFLCTANANRSQMAEGWARHLHGEWLDAFSAGTHPSFVNHITAMVMGEASIDMSQAKAKHVSAFKGQAFDLAVTVCEHAQQECPAIPGALRTIHHEFFDPPYLTRNATSHEEVLVTYRMVRDQIGGWVEHELPKLFPDRAS